MRPVIKRGKVWIKADGCYYSPWQALRLYVWIPAHRRYNRWIRDRLIYPIKYRYLPRLTWTQIEIAHARRREYQAWCKSNHSIEIDPSWLED